jgi:hypothetical protein
MPTTALRTLEPTRSTASQLWWFRVGTVAQHVLVVVGLEQQQLAAEQALFEQRCDDAGIGAQRSAVLAIVEDVGDRLGGVVGGRDRSHPEGAETPRPARPQLTAGLAADIDSRPGSLRRPHRGCPMAAQEDVEAADVVRVLMRQEDDVDILRRPAEGFEPLLNLQGRNAGVDEDRCLSRRDQDGIAR